MIRLTHCGFVGTSVCYREYALAYRIYVYIYICVCMYIYVYIVFFHNLSTVDFLVLVLASVRFFICSVASFCAALAKRWKVQFRQGFAYFNNNVDSKRHIIIRTAILCIYIYKVFHKI